MAHLHAILATTSPSALLVARGPGSVSCTVGWDRRSDSFVLGQWLRKAIHHRDVDLSPDGRYFVYYVNDHSWTRENHIYRAISLSPWLKARAFWGSAPRDFGPGVGHFFTARDGSLRLRAKAQTPDWDHLGIETVADLPETEPWKGMATTAYFFVRLQRDGWVAITPWEQCTALEAEGHATWRKQETPHRIIFEKPMPFGWKLRQANWCGLHDDPNRGIAWEAFALVSPTGEVDWRRSWEWADFDSERDRVVFTEDRVLSAASITANGLGESKRLYDARIMSFEERIAPY